MREDLAASVGASPFFAETLRLGLRVGFGDDVTVFYFGVPTIAVRNDVYVGHGARVPNRHSSADRDFSALAA